MSPQWRFCDAFKVALLSLSPHNEGGEAEKCDHKMLLSNDFWHYGSIWGLFDLAIPGHPEISAMLRTETVTGLNVEKHKVEQIPCCSDMLTSTIKVIEFAQSAFSAVSDTATSAIVVVQFTY